MNISNLAKLELNFSHTIKGDFNVFVPCEDFERVIGKIKAGALTPFEPSINVCDADELDGFEGSIMVNQHWIGVFVGVDYHNRIGVIVHGECTIEDDDALDGTAPNPTALGTQDYLNVARVLRALID